MDFKQQTDHAAPAPEKEIDKVKEAPGKHRSRDMRSGNKASPQLHPTYVVVKIEEQALIGEAKAWPRRVSSIREYMRKIALKGYRLYVDCPNIREPGAFQRYCVTNSTKW